MKKEQKLIFRLLPLLIAAVIAALLPQMIRNEYYMTIACQILIYLIAVCGLNFITGLTGQMNLGTAGMFAMGAYVSGLLNVKLGVSPWLGLVAALCVGWLIGKALGYPSLRLRGVRLGVQPAAGAAADPPRTGEGALCQLLGRHGRRGPRRRDEPADRAARAA